MVLGMAMVRLGSGLRLGFSRGRSPINTYLAGANHPHLGTSSPRYFRENGHPGCSWLLITIRTAQIWANHHFVKSDFTVTRLFVLIVWLKSYSCLQWFETCFFNDLISLGRPSYLNHEEKWGDWGCCWPNTSDHEWMDAYQLDTRIWSDLCLNPQRISVFFWKIWGNPTQSSWNSGSNWSKLTWHVFSVGLLVTWGWNPRVWREGLTWDYHGRWIVVTFTGVGATKFIYLWCIKMFTLL